MPDNWNSYANARYGYANYRDMARLGILGGIPVFSHWDGILSRHSVIVGLFSERAFAGC